jgi:hypothetical protein
MSSALPPDPRVARQRAMALYLRLALAVSLALGAATLVVPPDRRDDVGIAMVVVLVATPLGRVAWLGVRWLRRGDRRFALAAGALLVVMLAGVVVAHR